MKIIKVSRQAKTVIARAVGTRDDLDLRSRWWHRLVVVSFVSVTCVVAIGVALMQRGVNAYNLSPSQRVVTTDLLSFAQGFKGSGNPVIAFNAQAGMFGVESGADDSRNLGIWLALDRGQVICRRPGELTVDEFMQMRRAVQIEPMPNRPGEAPDAVKSVCWGPADLKDIATSTIIKFKATRVAIMARWIRNAVIGGVTATCVAFFLALVYYRGVIYVAFGSRKRAV